MMGRRSERLSNFRAKFGSRPLARLLCLRGSMGSSMTVWTAAGAVVVARQERHQRRGKAGPVQAVVLARSANLPSRN